MLLGTALSVVGLWAIRWLGTKNRILADAEVRRYLQDTLLQGLGYGIEKTREFAKDKSNVTVRSALVAEAAGYVINQVPDALRRFKIDSAGVKRLLEARLPLIDVPSLRSGRTPDVQAGTSPSSPLPNSAAPQLYDSG